MLREFKVDANVGKPQVAYRETIRDTVREDRRALHPPDRWPRPVRPRRHQPRADRTRWRLRVRRQDHRRRDPAGVHPGGQPGHPRGDGVRACSPASRRSTCGSSSSTARTTTSTPRRWRSRSPARWRSRRRCAPARPVLLEPIMAVEVVTPEDYMGDVIGDLSSRRGKVEGMEQRGTSQVDQGAGSALRYVRLRYRPALAHPGARDVHDAVQLLPGRPGVDRPGDHRPGDRRVDDADHWASRLGERAPVARLTSRASDKRTTENAGAERPMRNGAVGTNGQAEVRAEQAARQRRDDGPHRPRQDDAHRGDHQGPPRPQPDTSRSPPSTRSTRRLRRRRVASPSRSPTSSTRPTTATTRTSTCPVTPTTSRT